MAKKSTCLAEAKKRRRVLYIITKSVWGGAAKYVYDLSINLSGEFNIAIAAGGKDKFYQKIKQAQLSYYQISNFQKSINPFKDLLVFFEILSLFIQYKRKKGGFDEKIPFRSHDRAFNVNFIRAAFVCPERRPVIFHERQKTC